mmetsp:Transcript_1806/g.6983  ORF Transcript_1806/g.6983 Transcript_1806/m.6983 type:complete len:306 (-) Transcript_1806:151-1068(-)
MARWCARPREPRGADGRRPVRGAPRPEPVRDDAHAPLVRAHRRAAVRRRARVRPRAVPREEPPRATTRCDTKPDRRALRPRQRRQLRAGPVARVARRARDVRRRYGGRTRRLRSPRREPAGPVRATVRAGANARARRRAPRWALDRRRRRCRSGSFFVAEEDSTKPRGWLQEGRLRERGCANGAGGPDARRATRGASVPPRWRGLSVFDGRRRAADGINNACRRLVERRPARLAGPRLARDSVARRPRRARVDAASRGRLGRPPVRAVVPRARRGRGGGARSRSDDNGVDARRGAPREPPRRLGR